MEPINRNPEDLFPSFKVLAVRMVSGWNLNHPREQIGIFEGLRSFPRQAYLYSLGRTIPSTSPCYHDHQSHPVGTCPVHPLGAHVTNAPEGLSWHNYGLAIDAVFDADPVKPALQASWDGRFPWDRMGAFGQSLGLEWAGAWKSFPEKPHFQNVYGLQITEARELYRQGGLQAVWAEIKT